MTLPKTVLALAILCLALSVGPSVAAESPLADQQPAVTTDIRVEIASGESIAPAAYNAALDGGGPDHYCGARVCDTAPSLLDGRAPLYPPGALAAEIEGRAALLFDIDARGIPQDITVHFATAPEFGEAAVDAVRRWRFRPATVGGKAVTYQRALQLFPFELRD